MPMKNTPTPGLLLTETDEGVPRLALRPREAAIALGLSERKLWSLTAEGQISCRRAGRVKLYAIDELREFLRRKTGADS